MRNRPPATIFFFRGTPTATSFRACSTPKSTLSSADSCTAMKRLTTLSVSVFRDTGQVSRGKFNGFSCILAGSTHATLDMDFAIICLLVRLNTPYIRFLFVESQVRSTLPSDPASRLRPCASLQLPSSGSEKSFTS